MAVREAGIQVCLCKYIFCSFSSCPLLLLLSYFGAEGIRKVASRSREVFPLLLTWLASIFGHPRRKPVNWTKATRMSGWWLPWEERLWHWGLFSLGKGWLCGGNSRPQHLWEVTERYSWALCSMVGA